MRAVRLAPALVTLALAGCGQDPMVVPVRNLERPSDMGFACLRLIASPEAPGGQVLTGRPMSDCHPHLLPQYDRRDPVVDFGQPRVFGTFGFVTNTARGELAVVDLDANRLVDLDPAQPGYNMAPLGSFPEVLSASQDGCKAVSANRGSCDLSVIDTQRLMAPFFGNKTPSTGSGPATIRVTPVTRSGQKLRVAPQEVSFLPQSPDDLPKALPNGQSPADACNANGTLVAGARVPWRAVVTFPSCDLVAVVELPSGQIVSSVYVRSTGVVDAGDEPVCPVECGAGVTPRPVSDAAAVVSADAAGPAALDTAVAASPDTAIAAPDAPGAEDAALPGDASSAIVDGGDMEAGVPADGGAGGADATPVPAPTGPFRIGALAIRPAGDRLYVGGATADFITAIDIASGALKPAVDGGRIRLHDAPGGVTRLRLSLDPFTVTGQRTLSNEPLVVAPAKIGRFLGSNEAQQFLYAIARDNSIRVLDVTLDPTRSRLERECDVNVDPQFQPQVSNQACQPLLDDPGAPVLQRRAGAQGPGLRIPNNFNPEAPPPVPLDIAFAALRASTASDANAGDFGYVLASNQAVYVLNVDSASQMDRPPGNTWRDANLHTGAGGRGRPRVPIIPGRNFIITDVPLPTRVPLTAQEGPRLEGISTTNPAENPAASSSQSVPTWVWFPTEDPTATSPQSWLAVWEGTLPGSDRGSGALKPPGATAQGPAGTLEDLGAEFCQVGVLPKDVLLLPGCTLDSDCMPLGTAVCRQSVPGTPGLCLPTAVARDTTLLALCARHLSSRRRYEVLRSTPTHLELGLKVDELPKTSLNQCQTDEQCRPTGFEGFACLQVREGEPKRCVKPCGSIAPGTTGQPDDLRCRTGMVCEVLPGSSAGPLCVEGPPIRTECWPTGTPYKVQAGQSFLVGGSATPRPSTAVQRGPAPNDDCVEDLARNPFLVNRIPLNAPHCTNVPDDVKDNSTTAIRMRELPKGPPGTWGNPCLFRGENVDETATNPPTSHVKALFRNQQLRFIMTNLETYGGDADITRFDVIGGFTPDTATPRDDIIFTIPVRITTGPTYTPESPAAQPVPSEGFFPYIYVVDQGRTATSIGGRGQILRLNPRGGRFLLPLFDSTYSSYPFQIQ